MRSLEEIESKLAGALAFLGREGYPPEDALKCVREGIRAALAERVRADVAGRLDGLGIGDLLNANGIVETFRATDETLGNRDGKSRPFATSRVVSENGCDRVPTAPVSDLQENSGSVSAVGNSVAPVSAVANPAGQSESPLSRSTFVVFNQSLHNSGIPRESSTVPISRSMGDGGRGVTALSPARDSLVGGSSVPDGGVGSPEVSRAESDPPVHEGEIALKAGFVPVYRGDLPNSTPEFWTPERLEEVGKLEADGYLHRSVVGYEGNSGVYQKPDGSLVNTSWSPYYLSRGPGGRMMVRCRTSNRLVKLGGK